MAWTRSRVESAKARIKAELDQLRRTSTPRGILKEVMQRIDKLRDQTDHSSQMELYVYCIHALLQHQRHGGLDDRQIQKIRDIVESLLFLNGVQARTSNLSFMFGELHLALSQIYRQSNPVRSAWEQQLAMMLARRSPATSPGFHQFSTANRSLRLGNAMIAHQQFDAALKLGLAETPRQRALVGCAQSLRLSGQPQLAQSFLATTTDAAFTDPEVLAEWQWEKIIVESYDRRSIEPLMTAVRKGNPHFQVHYLVEASLWTKVVAPTEWLTRPAKMSTLARRSDMSPKNLGQLFQTAQKLDECYDYDIPLSFRIRDLGDELHNMHLLPSIDLVLLAWCAAARWLARSKAFALAQIALNEYTALCLRLSNGQSRDTLGFAEDMLERNWFSNTTAASCDNPIDNT